MGFHWYISGFAHRPLYRRDFIVYPRHCAQPLLQLLRESGHSLRNGLHCYGALAYCDDLVLLATSVDSLQKMVNICSDHAAGNDLLFSTHVDPLLSKTVCIAFHCKNKEQLPSIMLNNDPLPWKTSAKHIGCLLHEDGTMDSDIKVKQLYKHEQ